MKYQKEIDEAAKKHGFNSRLIRAICIKESGLDTWAMRFEPNWRWWVNPTIWARRVGVSARTEHVAQQCSWGLMQIMGTVARERGFAGDLPKLCKPSVGLEYGCLHLQYLFDRYSDVRYVLSAYNTGRPDTKIGRAYAADVIKIMSEL